VSQRSPFLERMRVRGRQTRERALVVVADLDDAQLSWRPTPKAHSVGYTLWHLARTEDNFQNDVNGRGTVWTNGGFAAKWGYPEKGVGVGWEDERAAALAMPGKERLLEYVRATFAAADEAADKLDEGLLNEKRHSSFLDADAILGEVLLGSVTHGNRHLGEMEYIKGLQGMKGSATT
jgi:uncharacterized damage-inducible protein DinB